jgi:CheY-like chemotaxis protein
VLVADDSKVILRVIERLLTTSGLEVALAASGEQALAWLSKERPDLIISDVNMPDRSGYEICNYVRSQGALSSTPLLLISGMVNDEVTQQAEACRADGVLKKPFDEALFKSRVFELLARRPARPAASAPGTTDSKSQAPVPAAPGTSAGPQTVSEPPPRPAEEPTVSRITENAVSAFQRTVANLKKLETALAEERAQTAHLTQQLASTAQDKERIRELESLLAQEQAKSAQLMQRLRQVDRALGEAKAETETMTRAMAEINRLAGEN